MIKLTAETETGSSPASSDKGYITQCLRNLPLHVNGKNISFQLVKKAKNSKENRET